MGSIFASQTEQTRDLPFDPPHTATIRPLTGLEVLKARQIRAAGETEVPWLLQTGIVRWSYERPVTAEAIADLTITALEWFTTEIGKLTFPEAYQTDEEKAVAQKNG